MTDILLVRPNCRRISCNEASNVRLVHVGLTTDERLNIAGCRLRLEILAGSRSAGLAVVVVYVSIVVYFGFVVSHRYRGAATGARDVLEKDIRGGSRLIPRLHGAACEKNSGPLGGREGGTLGDLLRLSQRLQGASGLT